MNWRVLKSSLIVVYKNQLQFEAEVVEHLKSRQFNLKVRRNTIEKTCISFLTFLRLFLALIEELQFFHETNEFYPRSASWSRSLSLLRTENSV